MPNMNLIQTFGDRTIYASTFTPAVINATESVTLSLPAGLYMISVYAVTNIAVATATVTMRAWMDQAQTSASTADFRIIEQGDSTYSDATIAVPTSAYRVVSNINFAAGGTVPVLASHIIYGMQLTWTPQAGTTGTASVTVVASKI